MSKWQPIETAPEAFIDVLLWDDNGLGVGFLTEEGEWLSKYRLKNPYEGAYEGAIETVFPHYWMPLPEPPEEE